MELAGKGTVFLDEISEMPMPLQSKLLRVLEEREFYRVGGTRPVTLRSRVIVSTNRKLRDMVAEGYFRQDLYFRVAVFEIVLPPLRDRRSDIPLLADHFVKRFNREMTRRCLGIDSDVVRVLMTHSWPGNVRELRNVVEHAMIVSRGDYIALDDLPAEIRAAGDVRPAKQGLREAVHAYEREHIRRALAACGGNREETARRLGVNPSTLHRKMSEWGLRDTGQVDTPGE
jgi:DNA-binding NtrC family response regulator